MEIGHVRRWLGPDGNRFGTRRRPFQGGCGRWPSRGPLLEASIDGAHGVLLSIQGGSDLGLFEINEAAQLVANSAAPDANIIFGAVIDDALGDEVRVTVIAAGFDETGMLRARPVGPGLARLWPDTTNGAVPGAAASPAANGAAAQHSVAARAPAESAAMSATGVTRPEAAAQAAPAPVPEPDEAAAYSSGWPATPAPEPGSQDAAAAAATPAPEVTPAGTARHRTDHGAAARMFDAATSTRRRSVVFEEDDELDVPDFLK